jgi:hypothetical protein
VPFPLAHPVAALPLRRLCPKYFDFSSLIIGSITPDLAASIDDWEYFSHSILGSLGFCLPVGILTLWLFQGVRTPLVSSLPNPHRDLLLPYCARTPKSLSRVILSLLLGAWLHIVWDLFTHDHSPLVRHTVLSITFARFPLNHIIWLLSSLIGCVLLLAMYLSLLRNSKPPIWCFSPVERRSYALWCGILLFPFAGAIPLALHDYVPGSSAGSLLRFLAMYYIGCAYLTLSLAGLLLKALCPREMVEE